MAVSTPPARPAQAAALADNLRPAVLRLSRRLRQEGQRSGLSVQEVMLLGHVRQNPGVGVSALADFEQTSRPTMSVHVKRLEAAGLLVREDNAEDGRRSGLKVTDEAARKLDAIKRQRTDWLAQRLAKLTPEDRDHLSRAIGALQQLAGL